MVDSNGVRIVKAEHRTLVLLKSWLPNRDTQLPTSFSSKQIRVLSLAPGEWLITSDALGADRMPEYLETMAHEHSIPAVDLSDGLAVFTVAGPAARALLSKGCGLDLRYESFPIGHSTRTRFAQLPVIMVSTDSISTFELYVDRSLASYLLSWLNDLAVEFSQSGAFVLSKSPAKPGDR